MTKYFITFIVLILTLNASAQDDQKTAISKLGPNPLFLIDSQIVKKSDLSKYSADSIATLQILYDSSATKLFGDIAKDGAVIIETRSFDRRKFISYFRKSSKSFDSLYSITGNDQSFAYIINDKVQSGNYEGNLSAIGDEEFKGLEILTAEDLNKKYNVSDRKFGILIHAEAPKDLYNADKKF
ncbi:MAG: hypothetical protein ABI091_22960 [Ferruginibacter sp.]